MHRIKCVALNFIKFGDPGSTRGDGRPNERTAREGEDWDISGRGEREEGTKVVIGSRGVAEVIVRPVGSGQSTDNVGT